MAVLYAYQDRAIAHNVVITDVNGDTIEPQDSDVLRVRITQCGTEHLVVTSAADTANGSSVTKGASNRVCLAAEDLDFAPGTYTYSVELQDGSDGDWKEVAKYVLHLEDT